MSIFFIIIICNICLIPLFLFDENIIKFYKLRDKKYAVIFISSIKCGCLIDRFSTMFVSVLGCDRSVMVVVVCMCETFQEHK